LRTLKHALVIGSFCTLAIVAACAKSNVLSPSQSGGTPVQLTAPTADAPADDEQLVTLRPTLSVRNGTSNQTGTRTYEFQIADNANFSPVAITRPGIAEDASGKTSFTPDADLQASTRFYWRARATQGTTSSDWSPVGKFRTKVVGYNRPGELYDPLTAGETLGTIVGGGTFVTGQGLRIDTENSYVRYQLPQTLSSGEMSVEVQGLRPNGPGQKLKIFSMMDGTGDLISSRYQLSVQYRGLAGNPDNCISFKAVWGDKDVKLEPDFGQRADGVRALDPTRTYLWQAFWTSTTFRLVIRDGGLEGAVIYDRSITAPAGTGPYSPSPHYVYLGANSGAFNTETGSWPGAVYRNLWVGNRNRPVSLGSSLRVE
jgi:hypothetical protein